MSKYRLVGGPLDGVEVNAMEDRAIHLASNLTGKLYVECWYWPARDGTARHTRTVESDGVPVGAIYVERTTMDDPYDDD
jgi:hypothetical protein